MKYDLILITGCPGSGKSTIAQKLYDKLQSVYLDLGKLREPHLDKEWKKANKDEEKMAFENLISIVKNYIKKGYKEVLLDDLLPWMIKDLEKKFKDKEILIITLTVTEKELKNRLETRTTSGFKNLKKALEFQEELLKLKLKNQIILDNSHNNPEKTLKLILEKLK